MKFLIVFPIFLSFLFPTKMYASRSSQVNSVCQSFAAGKIDALKIDALKTLEALDLDFNDYSIGITNTAKIFCA